MKKRWSDVNPIASSDFSPKFLYKKFIKEQLVNKSGGKFNKLLETKEEILDYLKFLNKKKSH